MNSALIIRGGAIGDFILTLPSIHAFRDYYPNSHVEIMGYPHIAELACQRFYAARIRSIEQRAVAGFFAAKSVLDQGLCEYFSSFDMVVSYLYDPDTIFADNLKRAGACQVVVADSRPSVGLHASEYLAKWLFEVGVLFRDDAPKLYPTNKDSEEADLLFPVLCKPTVALHIGSGSQQKNWPIAHFLEMASWLKTKGVGVLVITGPADSEVEKEFWKDPRSRECVRCHHVSLPMVAAALQKCIAFVGHDSGISHLSAAVGTPTIAIFGATDPKQWSPRGKFVVVLQQPKGSAAVTIDQVKAVLEPHVKNAK